MTVAGGSAVSFKKAAATSTAALAGAATELLLGGLLALLGGRAAEGTADALTGATDSAGSELTAAAVGAMSGKTLTPAGA